MIENAEPIRLFRTQRARPLSGMLTLPGDTVIAQRALLVAAMARGQSRLENIPQLSGVIGMVRAISALGARVEVDDAAVVVDGLGVGGFLEPLGAIDAGALGEGDSLLLGATGIYPFETRFAGIGRPPSTLAVALDELGIRIEWNADRPGPLTVRGPAMPIPGPYGAATEEAKNALLLAAVNIPGTTTILQPFATLDHTERLLATFGAEIETTTEAGGAGVAVRLEGLPDLRARSFTLPGDPAVAAPVLVAGLVVPGAAIEIDNVLLNPWRASLLELLLAMGGDLQVISRGSAAGEDIGRLSVRHSVLSGIRVPAARTALLGKELAMLILAAAFARGDTIIDGAAPTETDAGWLAAVLAGLAANTISWRWDGDALVIQGQGRVTGGGSVRAHPDPHVPLVFLIMGMATRDPLRVEESGAIEGAYPGLLDAFTALGATFKRDG